MSLLRRKYIEEPEGWTTAQRLYNYAKDQRCTIDEAAAILRKFNGRVTLSDVDDAKALATRLENHEKKLRMHDNRWLD